jgi:hypothetical protein
MKRSDAGKAGVTPCFPLRRADLHVEELDGEAVVYDPRNGAVHRLNATSFFVWSVCDGLHAPNDIAASVEERYSIDKDEALSVVGSVVAQLFEKDLLYDECDGERDASSHTTNRAELVSRVGRVDAPGQAMAAGGSARTLPTVTQPEAAIRAPSRREILGGGVTKAVLAAPVISTFFAAGAYASGPSGSAAFGPDGCKTVGYSCTINADCCESGATTACQDQGGPTKSCCVQHNRSGCTVDNDCCNATDVCVGGFCG